MTAATTSGVGRRVTIIAEFACIHEGDRGYLLELARAAKAAGADAVKFQVFSPDEVVAPDHPDYAYLRSITFTADEWGGIVTDCAALGLGVWVDVSGPFSLAVVAASASHVTGVKIHSSEVANDVVFEGVRKLGLPVAVGCGGTPLVDLFELLDALGPEVPIVLLHGYQSFPKAQGAPGGPPADPVTLEDLELWHIARLRATFPRASVGLADHLAGADPIAVHAPALAVALGATVIEKHITLDRSARREDYFSSLEPEEFRAMALLARAAAAAVGEDTRAMRPKEAGYQREMKRTTLASRDLGAGATLARSDLVLERDGSYASSARATRAVGRRLARPLAAGERLTEAHLVQKVGVFCNARLASSRLPRKALLPFYGEHTTLSYLLARLVAYPGRIGDVVLATTTEPEDDALEAIARRVGVPCFRGENADVMGRMAQAADHFGWDVLVRVTGDDQFVSAEYIERALEHHLANSLDYTRVDGLTIGLAPEVIDVRTLKRIHRAVRNKRQTEHLTWYLDSEWTCRNDVLTADPEDRDDTYRVTLDYREDYDLMREVARRCHDAQEGFYVPSRKVLETLREIGPSWRHDARLWTLKRSDVDTGLVYSPGGRW